LEAGADPNDSGSGLTPLHLIVGVRKAPKGDGADGIPEPEGSGSINSLEMVRELVKRGANLNAQFDGGGGSWARSQLSGATPFLLAAHADDLPYMKLLVELGADPTITNKRMTTPLMAAAGVGVQAPGEEAGTEVEALATVIYLLDHGADINAVDDRGETAMHGAAYKAVTSVITLLDERGADIAIWNRKNKYGWTPLLIGQGYRFGNYRPIKKTEVAIKALMVKHGVEIPQQPKPR
jgi:ankyrin repeat protein